MHLTDLASALPDYAIEAIREALPAFDQQIKGFAMDDAVLTGVETRTSSPMRITRGDDYQSLNVKGLYPAGEGAGYAGGILSAGVDGIRVAEAVALSLLGQAAPAGSDEPQDPVPAIALNLPVNGGWHCFAPVAIAPAKSGCPLAFAVALQQCRCLLSCFHREGATS